MIFIEREKKKKKMGFITKLARVETEFTEEQWEKWERKRAIELRKELLRLSKKQPFSGNLLFIGVKGVLKGISDGEANPIGDVNRWKLKALERNKYIKEEAIPLFSKFTYETHSFKEAKELFDAIRDTALPGVVINWINDEKTPDEIIPLQRQAFQTPFWSTDTKRNLGKTVAILIFRDDILK